MDLRWAHQSLVAEIIAMVAVIVAILSEYMVTACDTKTGQLALAGEGPATKTEVFPVLTSDFSCAQTVSLLVSDFIVLAVMILALVFSTSIWHHKFHAMKNIMKGERLLLVLLAFYPFFVIIVLFSSFFFFFLLFSSFFFFFLLFSSFFFFFFILSLSTLTHVFLLC
jgi:hypothetical protein